MLKPKELSFYNPTRGDLNFDETIEEIFNYMSKDSKEGYEVVVGCDSPSDKKPDFPIAIVVLKKGRGGRFFLTKLRYKSFNKKKERIFSFQERILEEVYSSCKTALTLRDALEDKEIESDKLVDYEFEYIHADVGQNGRTKDMIKEVVGLIKSNGFQPKIKPESFAASVVADRFT